MAATNRVHQKVNKKRSGQDDRGVPQKTSSVLLMDVKVIVAMKLLNSASASAAPARALHANTRRSDNALED